jgi:cellulose synthase/poly-beta-1,6-N-acetylglucosamine synthase-like glycosyltransferase/putative flippase GtrA
LSGDRIRFAPPTLRIGPYTRTIPAVRPKSDPMAQFVGLETPKSLAMMHPLETVHSRHQMCGSGGRDGLLRRLASGAWEHRFRLVIFAVNGMNVFAVGLLIQVLLIRYAGMGHVPSYIVQTIASVQLSFLLSRFLTWGDRDTPILPALARFNIQQFAITGLGMAGYAGLEWFGMNYIAANIAVTAALTPVSFLSSHKWSLNGNHAGESISRDVLAVHTNRAPLPDTHRPRAQRLITLKRSRPLVVFVASVAVAGYVLYDFGASLFPLILLVASLFNLAVGSLEVRWRFYALRSPEAAKQLAWPKPIQPGQERIIFTSIVCALNEADVIGATLEGMIRQTHRRHQIIVSLRDHDTETIKAVEDFERRHPGVVDVIVGHYEVAGKHAQLNGALPFCMGDYIGPIDSEDDVAPELLVHVESLIRRTNADIVQGAVQLMNLGRTWREWFKVHNIEEYRAWYSSRMAFQVSTGFVPLGGNTVYTRASLLREVGGWPASPTEDCAIGVLMCARYHVKVVAAHSPELATREEVPGSIFNKEIGSLFWQRVRWLQGFFQELAQGTWLEMPTTRQKLLAGYILATPILQAVSCVLIPVALITAFIIKLPIGLTMFMFTPFIPMALTIVSMLVGVRTFGRDYEQKVRIGHYVSIVFLTPVYQVILAVAATVAVTKHLRGDKGWYKTARLSEHRTRTIATTATPQETMA